METPLSARNLAILAHGVRGGDGDDPAPVDPPVAPVDPPVGEPDPAAAPAEPVATDPPAAAPVAGDPPAPVAGDPAPAPVAVADPVVVPDLPADITAADEASLRELFGELQTVRTTAEAAATSPADVQVISDIHERQAAIAAELQRRLDAANTARARLEELETAGPPVLPGPAPVLASAAAVVRARGAQPNAAQNPAPARTRPRVPIMAALGVHQGQEVDLAGLGHLINQNKRGNAGRVILASLPDYASGWEQSGLPEPLSMDNSTTHNDRLIREATEDWRSLRRGEQPVRTAAICEPFDIIREIPSAFTAEDRVGPIFPSRPASRLGFQFTPSGHLSDVAAGSTIWDDDTDQAGVDPTDASTWKPIVDLTCPTAQPVEIEYVTAALRFDNTLEASNPERVANMMAALMAVKSRNEEARLLQLIDTLSSRYQRDLSTFNYGAIPQLIKLLNDALGQGTYADRLETPTYTLLLPPGVIQTLLNDRANKGFNMAEAGDLMTYISDNVEGVDRVVNTLDASAGGEGGIPFAALNPAGAGAVDLPELSNTYRIRLVEPSAAIFAETGEVNVGIQRSPDLNRMNKAQFFAEEGFLLAKHGPQPWFSIDVALCDNGTRAALTEPYDCADNISA